MKSLVPLAVLAASTVAQAAVLDFDFTLSGANETPPNASTATGSGTAMFDDATLNLTVNGTFSGLIATSTAAHVHDAQPGVPGPIVFGLTLDPVASTSGTISGIGGITPEQVTDLLAGNLYVNVHSDAFPDGEIRGQLVPVPEPQSYAVVAGMALVGFGVWRRLTRKSAVA
jgi:hypothetical protein